MIRRSYLVAKGKSVAKFLLGASWPVLSSLGINSSSLYKRSLVERVRLAKKIRAASPFKYTDSPKLSLILLSFNHRPNILPIFSSLRQTAAEELIVCDDGSIDGSEQEWLLHLSRPNDFLIRSNDIHEIRSYNRAIDFARGEIVCVLQDDDIPDPRGKWVTDALALFERYPKLAILGCWMGLRWNLCGRGGQETEPTVTLFGHQAEPLASEMKVISIPFVDPILNLPFMFVHSVGIGPIFFRRDVFRLIGGFDVSFSKPGEPGIHLDHDICFKAWLQGYHVGLFDAPDFQIGVGGQGTLMFGKETRDQNERLNFNLIKSRYADKTEAIDRIVDDLNCQLLQI
jgi:glycosyltransferase involved in cell wall biosynthesis